MGLSGKLRALLRPYPSVFRASEFQRPDQNSGLIRRAPELETMVRV